VIVRREGEAAKTQPAKAPMVEEVIAEVEVVESTDTKDTEVAEN
jgi:hypothetical protein